MLWSLYAMESSRYGVFTLWSPPLTSLSEASTP